MTSPSLLRLSPPYRTFTRIKTPWLNLKPNTIHFSTWTSILCPTYKEDELDVEDDYGDDFDDNDDEE